MFVFRKNTVERFFQKDYKFSRYDDISYVPTDVDGYVWFYQLPVKYDMELLAPVDESSPVCKTLEKNGVTPYHTCWIVPNIEEAALKLRKQRYVMVSKPAEAVAFCGSRVCFLFNKNVGLIELVEEPAEIIE